MAWVRPELDERKKRLNKWLIERFSNTYRGWSPEWLDPYRKKAIRIGIYTNLEMIKIIALQGVGNDRSAEILTNCASHIEEFVSILLGEDGQPEAAATTSGQPHSAASRGASPPLQQGADLCFRDRAC